MPTHPAACCPLRPSSVQDHTWYFLKDNVSLQPHHSVTSHCHLHVQTCDSHPSSDREQRQKKKDTRYSVQEIVIPRKSLTEPAGAWVLLDQNTFNTPLLAAAPLGPAESPRYHAFTVAPHKLSYFRSLLRLEDSCRKATLRLAVHTTGVELLSRPKTASRKVSAGNAVLHRRNTCHWQEEVCIEAWSATAWVHSSAQQSLLHLRSCSRGGGDSPVEYCCPFRGASKSCPVKSTWNIRVHNHLGTTQPNHREKRLQLIAT